MILAVPTKRGPVEVRVDVARTAEQLRRGLRGREALGPREGMWFVIHGKVDITMRGMRFPLDIVFLDAAVGGARAFEYAEDVQPGALVQPTRAYDFALELPAGFLRAVGADLSGLFVLSVD